jgi:hypothetical protein
VGARLELWERTRKIRRFKEQEECQDSASFEANRCKGHFESNEQRILTAFEERMSRL